MARKLMEAFEPLRDSFVLEELVLPEDLSDPAGTVELWLADARSHHREEEIVVRGKVGMPASLALDSDADGLYRPFGEELLGSELFFHAATVAGVLSQAADERGVPSPEEARKN